MFFDFSPSVSAEQVQGRGATRRENPDEALSSAEGQPTKSGPFLSVRWVYPLGGVQPSIWLGKSRRFFLEPFSSHFPLRHMTTRSASSNFLTNPFCFKMVERSWSQEENAAAYRSLLEFLQVSFFPSAGCQENNTWFKFNQISNSHIRKWSMYFLWLS